jgi:hypothetical protein
MFPYSYLLPRRLDATSYSLNSPITPSYLLMPTGSNTTHKQGRS